MNTTIKENVWNRVQLSQKEMQQGKTQNKRGAKISLYLSPTDVPSKMRTSTNESGDAVIEFKYLSSDEPTRKSEEHDGVTLTIGKRSGKIYEIHLSKSLLHEHDEFSLELELIFEKAEHSVESLSSHNENIREGNATAIANYLKSLAGIHNQLSHR